MARYTTLTGVLAIALVMALAGCDARVNEPWVAGDEDLKEERARAADTTRGLRERLLTTQIDR
jgi:hypothetical protein